MKPLLVSAQVRTRTLVSNTRNTLVMKTRNTVCKALHVVIRVLPAPRAA